MSTPSEALAALRAPDQRNQGRAHTPETGEVTAERLTAIEAHAVSVRAWNPNLVPGLLQTTRYAAAVIAAARPALPASEVQQRAHRRAARVDQFMVRWQQPNVHEAVFVVAEQAIRGALVHTQAHRAQLRQLLSLGALPNIRVHIMPTGRPVPGMLGQMTLYALEPAEPRRRTGVRVGYLETPVGGWYSTRSDDVTRLHLSFAELAAAALDPDDSRNLIQEALTA